MTVAAGTLVSFEYTLKDDEGNQIESNVGAEPLQYTHGGGQIVAGLERALEGMKVGETKEVVVKPAEGYGDTDPQAFVEAPKDQIPEEAQTIGAQLQASGEDGQVMHAVVSEVKEKTVTLDFNHPMAGKTLHFDVKVIEVSVAEK